MNLQEYVKLPGYEGLIPSIEKWERIAKREKLLHVSVPLPNYYIRADDGLDLDGLFFALAEYLEEKELMEFDGVFKVFSSHLKYARPDDREFPSFKILYDSIEYELTKYNRPFGGIIVVDITEWVDLNATGEEKFFDFLTYMDSIDKRTLAIFLDKSNNQVASDRSFAQIDIATRVENIELHFSDEVKGLDILKDALKQFGLSIDSDCEEKMKETVSAILSTPGNPGVAGLSQLAEDIAYECLGRDGQFKAKLDEVELSDFFVDGKWLSSFKGKKTHRGLGLI